MNTFIGLLLIAHAIAHLPGFVIGMRPMSGSDFPFRRTPLSSTVIVGDAGMRAMGFMWLLTSFLFIVGAFGAFSGAEWWVPLTISVTGLSLILSSLWWPETAVGLVSNGFILLVLLAQIQ